MNQFNTPISRRELIARSSVLGAGTIALGALVVACGSDSSKLPAGTKVVKRFPDGALVPGPLRLPVSLADKNSILSGDDLPATLTAKMVDLKTGKDVLAGLTATKHAGTAPQPYWPFHAEVNEPGIYKLVVDGADPDGAGFQLSAANEVSVPVPGDQLPSVETATFDNPLGIDPVCTLTPKPCPLHSISLSVALKSGKPVAYLLGTPAHCTTGTCAPALEELLDVAKEFANKAVFIHAEIYSDKAATQIAPPVAAYYMTYEPALFVTNAKGILVDRLDAVFDGAEIRASLKKAGIN